MKIRQQFLIWMVFALCAVLPAGHAAGIDGGDADEPAVEIAAGDWSSLGWSSLTLGPLRAVADLGIGPDGLLYAVAEFQDERSYSIMDIRVVTGLDIHEMVKWTGTHWLTVGPHDMPRHGLWIDTAVYDDGAEPAIYAVGVGVLFRLGESGWRLVGENMDAIVTRLVSARLAGGNRLVGVRWGGDDPSRLVAWDGHAWTRVSESMPNGRIQALLPVGDAVYIGGDFDAVGDKTVSNVVTFDGRTWSPVGAGLPYPVTELAASADGQTVYAAVEIEYDVNQLFAWDGQAWHAIPGGAVVGSVGAMAVLDGKLYVGGHYYSVAGKRTGSLAVWDGSTWTTLGLSHDSRVTILCTHAGGLYVAGLLRSADGQFTSRLMRWTPK